MNGEQWWQELRVKNNGKNSDCRTVARTVVRTMNGNGEQKFEWKNNDKINDCWTVDNEQGTDARTENGKEQHKTMIGEQLRKQ